MEKTLSEMSLEELWMLFPIILTEHNDEWDYWYEIEERHLYSFLPKKIVKISHIGSTAIKKIWAKPIIDILVELSSNCVMVEIKEKLIANGYLCMSTEKERMSFNKGYTENGFAEKVFHLHLRYAGDHDELYFRDYMNDNPNLAKEYEKLKCSLWKKFEHNRDAYTQAKGTFTSQHTAEAKEKYIGRYL